MADWLAQCLLKDESKITNFWTEKNLIPVGDNLYKGSGDSDQAHHSTVCLEENFGSNNIVIIGCPRSGKTTTLKGIYTYKNVWYRRPTMIIDPMSIEHHLSNQPNSYPVNMPPGVKPFGIKSLLSYSPAFGGTEIDSGSIKFAFLPKDLLLSDWTGLRLPDGAATAIDEAIERNKKLGYNLEGLSDFIRNSPRSYKQAESSNNLNEEFFIHSSSLGTLMKNLRNLKLKHFFAENSGEYMNPSTFPLILNKRPIVFRYHARKKFAPAYLGMTLRKLYESREKDLVGAPVVAIDEADMFAPAEDRYCEMGSTEEIVYGVRRAGKLGVTTITATQKFSSMHEDVSDMFSYLLIVGKLPKRDLESLGKMLDPHIIEEIKYLRYMPRIGYREMMVVYPDRISYDIIKPYNCPVEMYREKKAMTL